MSRRPGSTEGEICQSGYWDAKPFPGRNGGSVTGNRTDDCDPSLIKREVESLWWVKEEVKKSRGVDDGNNVIKVSWEYVKKEMR